MHEALLLQEALQPLRRPLLLAAFRGWNDSTGTALSALRYLRQQWGAREIARIDPQPFYDFTVQRPFVRYVDDERVIRWPGGRFYLAQPQGSDRDFVLLSGREPSMRWNAFTEVITDFMRGTGCTTCLMVGSRPAMVPHTRPPVTTLSNADASLEQEMDMTSRSTTYQGPTGIYTVLSVLLRSLGWTTGQLSVLVPHYLSGANPAGALALVQTLDRSFGTSTDSAPLRKRIGNFDLLASRALEQADNASGAIEHVQKLEEQYDAEQAGRAADPRVADAGGELPSGEELLHDVDEFLRRTRSDDD